MNKLIIAIALTACTTDNIEPHMTLQEACGERPRVPGTAAAFDGQGNVTMSVRSWNELTDYRVSVETWIDCVELFHGDRE